jgi:uncharacterized membrane protein (DUF4010 family)
MPESQLAMQTVNWPYVPILARLGLALAIGLFVGLERQRRGKEAGVRTFAFASLIGCLGGLLGGVMAPLCIGLLGLLVAFLNIERLYTHKDAELTTSAALIVVGLAGLLSGQGHTLTPSALAVLTAALLAWKESLAGFSTVVTEAEVRSAILLAILAFVVYPALPPGTIDPWGMVAPRAAWLTVLLIAGIGFANYILLKTHGPKAVELTGFFGGLVNSTVAVTALAERVRGQDALRDAAYRGIMLATIAMLIRNGLLLAILAPRALFVALPGLVLMLAAGLAFIGGSVRPKTSPQAAPTLELSSPFSLLSALKFGLLFLAMSVIGTLAQNGLGQAGFYAVSLVGGVVSSASAVASAGLLASQETVPVAVAGAGAALASVTSALVNLPLAARIAREQPLTRRIAWSLGTIAAIGLAGAWLGLMLGPRWLPVE